MLLLVDILYLTNHKLGTLHMLFGSHVAFQFLELVPFPILPLDYIEALNG